MKLILIAVIVVLLISVATIAGIGFSGGFDTEATPTPTPISTPTPTPTPTSTSTPTPTPLPVVSMSCVEARDATQDSISAYNMVYGEWPSVDGQPGDIEWAKLVPEFMTGIPENDSDCEWWVNSDPEGAVCVRHQC